MAKKETSRHLYEIEIALAKHDKFNFIRNVIAFNVNGWGSICLWHECDMLVLSKSGYLTEIEIKRSFADFKNDFKKKHNHANCDLIKYFFYCVPESILDKAIDYFNQNGRYAVDGFITYDENLCLNFHSVDNLMKWQRKFRKLTIEEQFQVARFGAMRSIGLKEKIINLKNNNDMKTHKSSIW